MTYNLKPCPFCGSEVDITSMLEPRLYNPPDSGKYAVVCWNCDLIFGFDPDYGGEFFTENEAAKAWNNRINDKQG